MAEWLASAIASRTRLPGRGSAAAFAEHRSATMTTLFGRAGVTVTEAFLASYVDAWEPHTFTDPTGPLAAIAGLRLSLFLSTFGHGPGVFLLEAAERDGARWPRSTSGSPTTCVAAVSITCA